MEEVKGVERGREGRVAPLQLGTLDPAVEEGREGRRARRGAWVGYFFSIFSNDYFAVSSCI